MQLDRSYGIVPVHREAGRWRFLLVHHKVGHWGFPKGHPESGEAPTDTARRELAEETGVQGVRLLNDAAIQEQYEFVNRAGERVRKAVVYFVGVVDDPAVTPCAKELHACVWLDTEQACDRLTFDEGRRVLEQAVLLLAEMSKP